MTTTGNLEMNQQRLADLLKQRENAFAYGREMGQHAAENYLAWPQIETIANAPAAQIAAVVKKATRHQAEQPYGATQDDGFVESVRAVYTRLIALG